MKKLKFVVAAVALGTASATAAMPLTSVKIDFLKAVHERDPVKAMGLLQANPSGLLDARDADGNTPLLITVARQDGDWTGYFITQGADVNMAGKGGDTPLIVAARIGFDDAVDWLLAAGARVDADNRMGETALIVAVQQRRLPIVKVLLNHGANPDKPDSAAGLSARDYAKRDSRTPQILQAIEAKKPAR